MLSNVYATCHQVKCNICYNNNLYVCDHSGIVPQLTNDQAIFSIYNIYVDPLTNLYEKNLLHLLRLLHKYVYQTSVIKNTFSFGNKVCTRPHIHLKRLMEISENFHELCFYFQYYSPRGVGRSRRYCNTGPTRGEVGASSCIFPQCQKSV